VEAAFYEVVFALRDFDVYGSTNKYRPLRSSKNSGKSGEYVTNAGGCPSPNAMAAKLAVTHNVNTIDTQR
jgi:hypothetical protein